MLPFHDIMASYPKIRNRKRRDRELPKLLRFGDFCNFIKQWMSLVELTKKRKKNGSDLFLAALRVFACVFFFSFCSVQ